MGRRQCEDCVLHRASRVYGSITIIVEPIIPYWLHVFFLLSNKILTERSYTACARYLYSFSRSSLTYPFFSVLQEASAGIEPVEVPAGNHRVEAEWDLDWFPGSWRMAHPCKTLDSDPVARAEKPTLQLPAMEHYIILCSLIHFFSFCPFECTFCWICICFLNVQHKSYIFVERTNAFLSKILFYKPWFLLRSFRNSRNQK